MTAPQVDPLAVLERFMVAVAARVEVIEKQLGIQVDCSMQELAVRCYKEAEADIQSANPPRFVVWSEEWGVYLGGGSWSKKNPEGKKAAVTYEDEAAFNKAWSKPPKNAVLISVFVGTDGLASVEACVESGMPAWSC